MILWLDDAHDATENMRRDAMLLSRLDAAASSTDQGEAVLRVYGFSPPGITLGLSQLPERELDLDACRRDGVAWAVRPTGGRAIYHDEEWTYALAARIDDPDWGGSLREAYGRASTLIVSALRLLGVPAELTPGGRRGDLDRPVRGPSAPCFASTGRHEIVMGERKLVGSAQRRTSGALLQQGSILLGPSHHHLIRYLPRPPGGEDPAGQLAVGATEIGPLWLPGDLDRLAGALAEAIGAGVRRCAAAEGLHLLTSARAAPYAATQRSHRDLQRPA